MAAAGGPKVTSLENEILGLLPEDGTPVLNRVMRVMLARELERPVDEDTFFAARDALMTKGAVGRLRGQGGQIFLTKPEQLDPEKTKTEPAKDGWSEADLMAPLRAFLEGPFRKSLDLPPSGACIVQNTSVMGPHKGKWARPDFILVSAMRFKLMPGAQVDLHSFELKTEAGGNVLAIHDALAQTRFTHFGHFVWHLPEGSKGEPARAIEDDGCEVLVDPRRKPTLASIVDGFLESRLSADHKERLMHAVGAS